MKAALSQYHQHRRYPFTTETQKSTAKILVQFFTCSKPGLEGLKIPFRVISVVMLSTALRLLVKLWTGNGLTQHTGGAADFYLEWVCKEHCHSVTCDKELKHWKEEKEQHWNCDELPSSSSVRAPVLRKVCTKLSQSTKKGYNSSLLCNSKQICYFSTWKFSEASKQDTPN